MISTADMKTALRGRFCSPEWALMFEVGDATGGRQTRWADAVAMNLWPSRGLEIHGFEIKISRTDWLRELKKAGKSDPVQGYCDRWWVFTPPGIVQLEELPPTWGLYELKGSRFMTVREAPQLSPKPLDRPFFASLIRRHAGVDESEVKKLVQVEVDAIRLRLEAHSKQQIEARTGEASQILAKAAEIEKATGIDITHWTPKEEIAAAIKAALDADIFAEYGTLLGHLERTVDEIQKAAVPLRRAMLVARPELLLPKEHKNRKGGTTFRR